MNSKTYIIILNWNAANDTITCLESVFQSVFKNCQIVVVDNGSSEESLSTLKLWTQSFEHGKKQNSEEWGTWCINYTLNELTNGIVLKDESTTIKNRPIGVSYPLIIIENNINLGFAEGNNVGIRYVLQKDDADYIWLLNSDTIVNPDTLQRMVEVMNDRQVVCVQSMLLNFFDNQKIDSAGIAIVGDTVADFFHGRELSDYHKLFGYSDKREIFGACAASALFRVNVLKDIGLLDPAYFTIYEDVDLAFRIRMKGYQVALAENAIVYHKRGITTAQLPSQRAPQFWRYIRKRSLITLKLKFWPWRSILISSAFYLIVMKALYISIKKGMLFETLNIWLTAVKFRMTHRYDRTELFKKWNIRTKVND